MIKLCVCMEFEEKREQIGYYLAMITGAKQRYTRFQSNEDDLARIKKINFALDKIDELIEGLDQEELQEVLGGEFSKDYMNGEPFYTGHAEIPAYFLLDVASGVLDKQCAKIDVLSGPTKETLERLQVLRDKAATLEFDPAFDPNKEIPKAYINFLSKFGYTYNLDIKKERGIRYVQMTIDSAIEHTEYKNGEYHSLGVDYATGSQPLYEADAKAIEANKEEEIQERLRKLDSIAQTYFKDGIIPDVKNFDDCLLDKDLDPRIISSLKAISQLKGEKESNRDIVESNISYKTVERISYVEEFVAKEQEEARIQNAIEAETREHEIELARQRYQSKSPFWKFFHRKQSVDKMDFDQMSTEQITGLYNDGKGKK